MKIKMRKAKKSDLKEILNLFNSSPDLKEEANINYAKYDINEYITGPIFTMIVAEIDKQIAGVALFIIFKKAKYLYLENIIVKEKFRNERIASKLEFYMESLAKKYKIELIYFYSEENNKIMHKFSEKHGFKKAKKYYLFWKWLK